MRPQPTQESSSAPSRKLRDMMGDKRPAYNEGFGSMPPPPPPPARRSALHPALSSPTPPKVMRLGGGMDFFSNAGLESFGL